MRWARDKTDSSEELARGGSTSDYLSDPVIAAFFSARE
jgi:hypothetical protein